MQETNKTEYEALKDKVQQIYDLTIKVEDAFNKLDKLVTENVNSGKGIWDGVDANKYKIEWDKIKEDIPSSINIFKIQADNIEKILSEKNKDE